MKATIFLPNGTRIEVAGTAEEIRRLAEPAPLWLPFVSAADVNPNATFIPFDGLPTAYVPGSVHTIKVGNADPHAHCGTVSASPRIGSGG